MLILRKIAITGSPAAGKSTVCRILKEEYGACIINADEIVNGLLSPNTSIGKKVITLLGSDIVVANQINKKKISEIVFADLNKLDALEKILHPAVRQEMLRQFAAVQNSSYQYFVAEVPLLFEAGMDTDFDTVITVIANSKITKKRFAKDHFEARHQRQLDPAIKASKSHFVITNQGDLKTLKSEIKKIIDSYLKEIE